MLKVSGDTYVIDSQQGEHEDVLKEGQEPQSGKFNPQASSNDAEALENAGNDQTIMDLAASFHGDDEVDVASLEAMTKAFK